MLALGISPAQPFRNQAQALELFEKLRIKKAFKFLLLGTSLDRLWTRFFFIFPLAFYRFAETQLVEIDRIFPHQLAQARLRSQSVKIESHNTSVLCNFGNLFDHFAENFFRADPFGISFEVENQPMAQTW